MLLFIRIFYCFLLFSLFGGAVQAQTDENKPLILQLKWFHSFQFAGYYAALEKGYYKEEGLNVEIRPRDIKTNPVDDVLAGRAHFGIADSSLSLRRLNGDPVVVMAVVFQHSALVLITLADNGFTTPRDLTGKKVMYQRDVDGATITAMFNEMGMTESDYVYVPKSFQIDALINGTADALSAYISNEPWFYKTQNTPVNIINPSSYGIDFYGDNLFTTEAMLERSEKDVIAFKRASMRGWLYALNNFSEVYGWLNHKYKPKNQYTSYEHFLYEANTIRQLIKPKLVDIGNINPNRFKKIADIYKEKNLAPMDSNLYGFFFDDYFSQKSAYGWKKILVATLVCCFLALIIFFTRYVKLKNKAVQKQLEIETSRIEKGKFLATISHEMRIPLNNIIGFSGRLLKSKKISLDQQSIHSLEAISRSSHELFLLINNLIDLSSIDGGNIEMNFSECDLAEVIDSCCAQLQSIATEKNLNLSQPSHYPITTIEADSFRLKQILSNLLSNAIKFTSHGGVNLRVEEEVVDTQRYCVITINDTGLGIRLKDQKRLEKRFQSTQKHNAYSTSLGISLIAEFTQLHGGHITFESTFGVGSSFSLHLPVIQSKK